MLKRPTGYPALVAGVLVVLGIGIIFYHFVEGFSWIDAYYFCVVTLATIGYGDLTPKTEIGKIFTTFYILVGVGIIGLFINTVIHRAQQRRKQRMVKRSKSIR